MITLVGAWKGDEFFGYLLYMSDEEYLETVLDSEISFSLTPYRVN